VREPVEQIIIKFMQNNVQGSSYGSGIKLSDLFRLCGFSCRDKENAASSQQKYWIVAAMRTLEEKGIVKRDSNKR